MPLIESAPNVVPWYATRRAIALYLRCVGEATCSSCRVSSASAIRFSPRTR